MLNRIKTVLATAVIGALAATGVYAQGEKKWKDQAEYDLVAAFTKEADPNKKIALLDQWKQKYPQTDFGAERLQYYLATYQALNRGDKMMDTAREMLAADPKNVSALGLITFMGPKLGISTPDHLDLVKKAATGFDTAEKPAGMADDAWKKGETERQALAHKALGWVEMQRKNNEAAEKEFRETLSKNPNDSEVSYWLGTVILGQRKPEKQSEVLYHFARAAAYDGPGALPAQGRAEIEKYLNKAYTSYAGPDEEGLKKLKEMAKSQVMPPADFAIESQLAKATRMENELREKNPQLALWMGLRKELTGPNGQAYFESSMKDAAVPKLKGKVVSHTPAVNPDTIVVGLQDAVNGEITLKIAEKGKMAGKADPGTEIEFEAVPRSFTADPFNVTMEVEKDKISGWPAQAAPPAKKAGGAKKGGKKK